MTQAQTEVLLREKLTAFVKTDYRNALPAHNGMRIYDDPLFGVAAADDPYFEEFRKPGIVGPDFLTPEVWLPGAKSVLSYFLPFTREIRDSNRSPGLPSEEWVSARIDGESFNNLVRAVLCGFVEELGSRAVSPCLDPRYRVVNRISNWSERHVAFAAGLGTFGLHRALITEKGTTGRFGSIVTTLELAPTPRPYTGYGDYCPYLTEGKCGACMKKCPPQAISPAGKDHTLCSGYIDREIFPRFDPRYGCAKCNIGVPCEYKKPTL